jgi:hypothetical protein
MEQESKCRVCGNPCVTCAENIEWGFGWSWAGRTPHSYIINTRDHCYVFTTVDYVALLRIF